LIALPILSDRSSSLFGRSSSPLIALQLVKTQLSSHKTQPNLAGTVNRLLLSSYSVFFAPIYLGADSGLLCAIFSAFGFRPVSLLFTFCFRLSFRSALLVLIFLSFEMPDFIGT